MPRATETTVTPPTTADLAARVGAVCRTDGADWSAPSPCAGWTADDVLDHVLDTERAFLAEHGVALASLPASGPADRWDAHAAQVVAATSDPAVVEHAFDGYFGPTTVGAAWSSFYMFDLVVHRWDLATAFGVDATLSDAELTLVEATVVGSGDALYGEGICAAPVTLPDGASRHDRALAATGRDPRRPPAQ